MESMSISKKEALSILLAFSDDSGGKTDTTSLSLTLARAGKSERRKHIRSSVGTPEQLISAALEISRTWRGYSCRKVLHDLFLGHDGRIQEKQIHAVKSETNPSSVMLSIHPVESSEQSLFNMAESVSKVMSLPQEPGSVQELPAPTPAKVVRPKCRVISSKYDAASVIQRAWRRHIDMQVFRYYRDLINFRGHGDPALMLKCINPNEAKLLDSAAGVHIRFRLAGEKFPPNIYYKIFTHRPVVDLCANSPKDYTKANSKIPVGKQIHNKDLPLNDTSSKDGWYIRHENNGWRLVSDRLIYSSMDPVTWETSKKTVDFHHVKLKRQADVDYKRRQRKVEWMKKMYKEGMLHARETDQDTSDLVDRAAKGLVSTVDAKGPDAVMEWEVDELLQWTTALNFDDYLEVWKESATSNTSEKITAQLRHNTAIMSEASRGGMAYEQYPLTRASSAAEKSMSKGDSPVNTRSKYIPPMVDATS